MFTQLRERLERELNEVAPHTVKVKVVTPANAVERRFSVWIGALPRCYTLILGLWGWEKNIKVKFVPTDAVELLRLDRCAFMNILLGWKKTIEVKVAIPSRLSSASHLAE